MSESDGSLNKTVSLLVTNSNKEVSALKSKNSKDCNEMINILLVVYSSFHIH